MPVRNDIQRCVDALGKQTVTWSPVLSPLVVLLFVSFVIVSPLPLRSSLSLYGSDQPIILGVVMQVGIVWKVCGYLFIFSFGSE